MGENEEAIMDAWDVLVVMLFLCLAATHYVHGKNTGGDTGGLDGDDGGGDGGGD